MSNNSPHIYYEIWLILKDELQEHFNPEMLQHVTSKIFSRIVNYLEEEHQN